MDPRELLQQAQAALQRGASVDQINQRLAARDDVQFNSLNDLRAAADSAQRAGQRDPSRGAVSGGILEVQPGQQAAARSTTAARPAPRQEGQGTSAFGAGVRSLGRGVLGGFGDEIASVLAGGAAAAVPGGQGFSEARQDVSQAARRQRQADAEAIGGIPAALLQGAGSLAPGSLIFKALRGANALRGVGAAGRAAIAGGAEGGILGVGTGETPRERAVQGLIGTGLGAATGGVVGARQASKLKPRAGVRLADEAEEITGLSGRASSRVEDDIARAKRQAREELIRPIEQAGEEISDNINRTIVGDDVLRENAEAVAPRLRDIDDVAEASLSAEEVLEIRRQVSSRASALQRAAGGDLAATVNPIDVKDAQRSLRQLDETLAESDVFEDFPEFRRIWRTQKQRSDALIAGRRLASKDRPADDMRAFFEGKPVADKGIKSVFPQGLPDDPAVRQAAKEGFATEWMSQLRRLSSPKAALRAIAREGSEQQQKLRAIMSEDQLDQFARAAQRELKDRSSAQSYEAVKRFSLRYLLPAAGLGGAGEATGILNILGGE